MLKTVRSRLILSHILPLLIIVPVMGMGLIYVLETQVYLPALSRTLVNNARQLADLTALEVDIWRFPVVAQELVNRQAGQSDAQIMLLDARGRLLASSNPDDLRRTDPVVTDDVMNQLRQPGGPPALRAIHYNQGQNSEVIDVLVPVWGPSDTVIGFVRMSYPFATLASALYQLRFLIFSLLGLGLLLGSGIGALLAVSLSKPIREVTGAIGQIERNPEMALLPEYGPEEIRMLAQSVNELVVRLRSMETARRHLLANLVHEIGRPLGAMRAAIIALSNGAEKDPVLYHDLVTGMESETAQLQRLMNDLARLYDQVLGSLEMDRKPLDLSTWLPGVLRPWQTAADEKGVSWQVDGVEGLPTISADAMRLAQVIGNLANNAIKFTPTGGAVRVEAGVSPSPAGTDGAPPGKQVWIAFHDTGPGVGDEEQKKIFEPFYRGAQGQRFPQGMGLGLSIAKQLTEAHGGSLLVESEPGQGSCFTVWLPVDG